MLPETPRRWLHPATIAEARAAQAEMAARIVLRDALPARIARIGGADVSNTRFDPARRVFAAIVTLDETGREVARGTEARVADFPYVPGYLGFREVPALLACWARLSPKPDLLLVDGQGVAHPRGFGLACHLGLVLDVPAIGVAKSLLVGEGEPGPAPGDTAPILWKGREIGVALRTRRGAGPLYVSPGHRVSPGTALRIVREACDGRRLPPAIRAAHAAANAARLSPFAASPQACPRASR